jgi:RNA polymerase sigma factor (sigma-70 family)
VTFPDFFDLVAEEHIDGPLQEEDEIANIRRLLRRLPPRHAMVLRARYLDGLTLRETAEILRVSKARVAQLERRALQIMRDLGYGDAQIDASTPDQKI